jgi:cytochrome b pre-mRNA-processing protein 3
MMQLRSLKLASLPYKSQYWSSLLASSKSQRCLSTQTADEATITASIDSSAPITGNFVVDSWFRWTNGSSVVDLKSIVQDPPKLDRRSKITWGAPAYQPPPPKSVSDDNAQQQQHKSYLSRWYQKNSLKGQTRRMQVAGRMFQAARRQANDPRWYGPGRIGRDFQSRHAMVTMHLWFLHHRLSIESPYYTHEIDEHGSRLMVEELMDCFWTDSTSRLRDFGINEWTMSKHISLMQKVSFGHLQHYDKCFTQLEGDVRTEELKIAIRRHVLGEDWVRRPQPQHSTDAILNDIVDRLVAYMQCQYVNILERMPDSFFHEGNILWVDVPDFSDLKDNRGRRIEARPLHPDDIVPIPWEQHWTLAGEKFYWNVYTDKTQMEHPGNGIQETR